MSGHNTTTELYIINKFIFWWSPSVFRCMSSRRVGLMPQRFCVHHFTSTDLSDWDYTAAASPSHRIQDSISRSERSTDVKPLLLFPQACRGGRLRDLDVIDVIDVIFLRMTSSEGEVAWHGLKVTATSAHARTNHLGSAHAQALIRACALLRELIN